MGNRTRIAWTDATWNPATGCTPESEGCRNCYAKRMHERFSAEPFSRVTLHPDRLGIPLRWRKPRRVFVCSMGDLFHPDVPFEFVAALFGVMAACPQHCFQILTKRPERIRDWMRWLAVRLVPKAEASHQRLACAWQAWLAIELPGTLLEAGWETCARGPWPLPNVWLGVTAENQRAADERIPILLRIPAAVWFVSVEPMLGPVDLREWLFCGECRDDDFWGPGAIDDPLSNATGGTPFRLCGCSKLDQVIVGAESGPKRRPCEHEWIHSLVRQCANASTACFVKQLHIDRRVSKDPSEWPEDLRVQQYPEVR